jgi:1-acyl-sn-glycerol-3-phosphate acyltransferase
MLALRSALFNVLFYALLIAVMVGGLPTMLMGHRAALGVGRAWAKGSLWLLRVLCGTRVEFRGRGNIPAEACLLAAKHQSLLEILALCSLFEDFTFVLKRELTYIPLFGWYLARAGQIAVDRGRGRAALEQVSRGARAVLGAGRQVFVFPEGTRRPPDAPPAYKAGLSFIYSETGAACLPVAVNTGLFWPRRSFLRRPGTAVVEFLPVIAPGLSRDAFQSRMIGAIEAASRSLTAEALEADPGLAPPLRNAAAPAA